MSRHSISILRTKAIAFLGIAWVCIGTSLFAQPHSVSNVFTTDTRHVHPQSEWVTGVFSLDARAVNGTTGFAFSGNSPLNTGGHLMGVPFVHGISPAIVPGLEGRQWVTIRGQFFAPGAQVILRTGGQVFVIPVERTVFVSGTEMRVFVNVGGTAAEWSAQVVNPGGAGSALLAFTVRAVPVTPVAGLDFGRVTPGGMAERVLTLRNGGAAAEAWSVMMEGGFFSVPGAVSGTLAAGQTLTVPVRYAPAVPGAHEGQAVVTLGGRLQPRPLSGRAVAAETAGRVAFSGEVRAGAPGAETPVPNAEVRLLRLNPLAAVGVRLRTDRLGQFVFPSVSPGDYEVEAVPPPELRSLGTLRQGVTVAAGAQPVTLLLPTLTPVNATPTQMPVVLVRGIGKKGENEAAYWVQMRMWLHDEGFTVWDPNADGVSRLDGEAAFYHNAIWLRQWLQQKVAAWKATNMGLPPPGLHFVAHSMGGLTARQMISDDLAEKNPDARLPGVRTLITLSTPHAGSLLANGSSGFHTWVNWRSDWASTLSMHTDLIRDSFRPNWPGDTRLRLHVAGGGRRAGTDGIWLSAAGSLLNDMSPSPDRVNDGAVAWHSSHGVYFTAQVWTPTLLDLTRTATVTHSVPGAQYERREIFPAGRTSTTPRLFDLNHTDIKESPVAMEWVADRLLGRVSSGSPAAGEMMAMAAEGDELTFEMTADESAEEVDWREVDLFTASVEAGAPVLLSAPLTGLGAARWVVNVAGAEVEARLGMPGGDWLTETGPGVDWQEADLGGGERQVTITLEAPAAGAWSLELAAPTAPGPLECAAMVQEQGGPVLEVEPHQRVPVGQTVTLLAAALDVETAEGEAVPVMGGMVEARIISPGGAAMAHALHDDGEQGDGAASDGVHGLTSAEFTEPGLHEVEMRFDAALPGGGPGFRRLARTSFLRAGEGGFIAGIEGHQLVDADADGWPEAVVLEVRVDNTVPGTFALLGTLAETEVGARLEAMTEFERDEAGDGRVNLVFDARGLPQGRECGPFHVAELRLLRVNAAGREWLHDHPPGYAVPARMFNGHARFLRVSGESDFGRVRVGQVSTRSIRIYNDGWSPLQVEGLSLPSGFSAVFAGEIEPGGEQEVQVTFAPVTAGSYGGVFEVVSDATAGAADQVWAGVGYEVPNLDDWLELAGVPPALRAPHLDANGDGLPNLLAFLFNVHPLFGLVQGDANAHLRAGWAHDAGDDFLTLTFRWNRDAVDLNVAVEVSETLAPESWDAIEPERVVNLGADPLTGDDLIQVWIEKGSLGRKFARLRVSEGVD